VRVFVYVLLLSEISAEGIHVIVATNTMPFRTVYYRTYRTKRNMWFVTI
jgi:hypothetical protein